MYSIFKKMTAAAVVASFIFASSSAFASGSAMYRVTITNITNSITFTPILVASHRKKLSLFELGSPAFQKDVPDSKGLEGLIDIAEGGDVGPLTKVLEDINYVVEVKDAGPLSPGNSVTVEVSASDDARRITVASMMLPTNDGFIALNGVKAPKRGSKTYYSPGYDAGTEPNDELCENIPGGGICTGEGRSDADNDEGYVHIHRGIHGYSITFNSDLAADVFDWRNPVAKITITRIGDDDDDD